MMADMERTQMLTNLYKKKRTQNIEAKKDIFIILCPSYNAACTVRTVYKNTEINLKLHATL